MFLAPLPRVFGRGTFRTSPAACRVVFFSPQLPEEELERYQAKIESEPAQPPANKYRDPGPANDVAPVPPAAGWRALAPATAAPRGTAAAPGEGVTAAATAAPRVFVGCGDADVMVDRAGAEEGAAYFGGPGGVTEVVMWEGVAHDCMLDAGWRAAADSLRRWLDSIG